MTSSAPVSGVSAAPNPSGGLRVLVGHPRPGAAPIVRAALTGVGVRAVEVMPDGESILGVLAKVPDLVLLHTGLLTGGPDLIARLRAADGMRDTPILVIGRFSGVAERAGLMRAGATDLIPHPLTRPELAARLRLHLENRSLTRSLHEVIRSLQAYHTGAVQRMRLARDMQLGLLPTARECDDLEQRYGIRLASHFESSSELGGDIWGARALDDRRFAVFLCDFTGHGVAAAMNTFRLHALLAKIALPGDDPAETLGVINSLLVGLLPETQFAAMLYAVIDTGEEGPGRGRLSTPPPVRPNPSSGIPTAGWRSGPASACRSACRPRRATATAAWIFRPAPFCSCSATPCSRRATGKAGSSAIRAWSIWWRGWTAAWRRTADRSPNCWSAISR